MRSLLLVLLLAVTACAPNSKDVGASTTTLRAVASTTPATTTSTTTIAGTTTTVALLDRILAGPAGEVEHAFPIGAGVNASYARTHSGYPATDVFADCGTEVRSMATGVVQHVRRVDTYEKKADNPALRGGKSVSIVGLDGVRYYTSHLDRIDVAVGQAVTAGDVLGTIGLTGDSEACHTHVGISPLCLSVEWSVRRGVIWPWSYLDAWRKGLQKSPAEEVRTWQSNHAEACATASVEPNAGD
jgi:peptidoglycan LD-endopeptidase LytH